MNHEGSSFNCGCAATANTSFFAKEPDPEGPVISHKSIFMARHGDDWMGYDEVGAWPAISMTTVKPQGGIRTIVAVGPNGQYWEMEPKSTDEWMGRLPNCAYPVRGVTAVNDRFFLFGMGRMVKERKDRGQWIDVGPGGDLTSGAIIGFEGLAAFSIDELYTVGWQGEIWWRDHGRWKQVDSPTSGKLNALVCASDGKVYAVGDHGVLVRGRADAWEVIDSGRGENLMDVAEYQGRIYACTDFRILLLDGDKLVNDRNFAVSDDVPATCLKLLPCPDAIFSMGPKDLFRMTDGGWERLV